MNLLTALDILELPEKYTPEMLKKNYHLMARKYHPDKNKESNANDKFLKVSEAYEFLNSPNLLQPNLPNFNNLNFIFKAFNPFNLFNQMPMNRYFTVDLSEGEKIVDGANENGSIVVSSYLNDNNGRI